MPVEAILRMALVGRYERITPRGPYQLGIISQVVDPPDRLRGRRPGAGRDDRQNSPAAMAATKRALWGALETGLTDACKAGAPELRRLWGHPDQEEGPLRLRRAREARW